MIVVGITGTIASGKSTVAAAFKAAGIPVFNADEAVRAIYDDEPQLVADVVPDAISDGRVDRRRLADRLQSEPSAVAALEAVVHPRVRERTEVFLAEHRSSGEAIAVIEVPLLFETGGDRLCDFIIVTTAPAALRAERVAARGTMSEALFRQLDARQLPDEEKMARADFVVDSSGDHGASETQTRAIIKRLRAIAAAQGG